MINKEYKDRLFVKLFGREEHRDWILSLYNAINGTSYTDAAAIEINTMEDVVYMGMKNDVSFLLGCEMNVYEHQSSYNPNMPVRMLSYLGMLYRKHVLKSGRMIYGAKPVAVPLPKLAVFYNGNEDVPDETILHLHDAFPKGVDKNLADVNVRVRMLNINYDHNRALMEACKPLSEYAWFVDKVREYKNAMDLEAAIDKTLNEMPGEYAIREYLIGNRSEVKMDFLTEYNEAEVMAYLREEAKEEGREEGSVLKLIRQVRRKLAKGKDADTIADELEEEPEQIEEIIDAIRAAGEDADAEAVYRKLRTKETVA